jgi:hypothetical protein
VHDLRGVPRRNLEGGVRRTRVDDDDLVGLQRLLAQAVEEPADVRTLVQAAPSFRQRTMTDTFTQRIVAGGKLQAWRRTIFLQ